MQENRIIHLRACVEGLFYKNIVDNDMVTNTINSYVNPYFFYPTLHKTMNLSLILKFKERGKFENQRNICSGL